MIGSNPATTSGVRTVNRAEKARVLLGFDAFTIANLLNLPTYRTGDVSRVGTASTDWLASRTDLAEALATASGVLLAHGTTKPSGPAREHYLDQLSWLHREVSERSLPVWAVGGQPRHPSRWQRFTHREYPGIEFDTALAQALTPINLVVPSNLSSRN